MPDEFGGFIKKEALNQLIMRTCIPSGAKAQRLFGCIYGTTEVVL
jgi:hypothetical protein